MRAENHCECIIRVGLHYKSFATLAFFHLWAGSCLVPFVPSLAAIPPAVAAVPSSDAAKVIRSLFEADVCWNLGQRERAREIYRKADPSGICPPSLVSAYMAARGGGERLYLEMEAARNGEMSTLRSALNRLYLERMDPYADPQAALELYAQAKEANPEGTFEHEEAIVELLKMAAAPGAFNTEAFVEKHVPYDAIPDHSGENDPEPYLLWDLAEKAAVEGSSGKPDPELVLQLAARGTGELSERLSAVRAAFENWNHGQPGRFTCLEHLSSQKGVRHAVRRMLADWEREQKQRADALLSRAGSVQFEALLKQALQSAEELAIEKSKYLHFNNRYSREWQYTFFLRWEVEKSLRLVDSVFSGLDPRVSTSSSRSPKPFQQWRVAAESEVPAHLVEDGLTEGNGPCTAFSETDELIEVLHAAGSCSESLAKVFAQISASVPADEWQTWVLARLLPELDGSVRVLERWDPGQAKMRSKEKTASLAPGEYGGVKVKQAEEQIAQDLTSLRGGLSASQTALFDSMKDAAFAWFKERSSLADGADREAASLDFTRAAQQTWLQEMEPILAGYMPSRVIPCSLVDPVLNVQSRVSREASSKPSKNEDKEADAWLEYRNRAGRFLATLSPGLSEEDWKGWLSEKRILELPSSAFAYTEEERERFEDEKHFEMEAEFKARFKRLETVFKDPRSMELNLEGTQGLVSSQDGRLRIVSWDTNSGGSGHVYYAMAQFRSHDGQIGHSVFAGPDGVETTTVAIGGEVEKIDTIATNAGETVYLVWSSKKGSAHRWIDTVTAVRLGGGCIEPMPIFQTKKSLLSDISIEYGGEAADTGAVLRLVRTKKNTLLVPIISDRYEFSGKFFKYVFDGARFVFSGMQ